MTDYSQLPDEMTSEEYLRFINGGGGKSASSNTRPSSGSSAKRKPATDWAEQLFSQLRLLGVEEPTKEHRRIGHPFV